MLGGPPRGARASTGGGAACQFVGRYDSHRFAASSAAASSATRLSPDPLVVGGMRGPPLSPGAAGSPDPPPPLGGEPGYIDALPSTMNTTSQNAGMYAPPAADGPNRQHTCGTRPDRRTSLAKMRPAPRRPGNSSTWSVMRAPAQPTRHTTGTS